MACFHCDCKRPPDAFTENKTHGFTETPQTERVVKRDDVSNAWNFDFDDDESDGAEVAAFEYADSTRKTHQNLPREDEFSNLSPEARESPDLDRNRRPGVGFDDFDDEDDINSYEIDEVGHREVPLSSEFSEDEQFPYRGRSSNLSESRNHRNKYGNKKGDDDHGFSSDDEVSATPKWKSSHVASTKRGPPSRKQTFGSDDDEFGLDSDLEEEDGQRSSSRRGGQKSYVARGRFKGTRSSYSASESDDDMDTQDRRGSNRGSMRGGRGVGFGDRPRGSFSDRPRGGFSDRPRGGFSDRPRGRGGRTGSRRGDDDFRGSRGDREDSEGYEGRMGSRRGGFDDRKSTRGGRGSGSFNRGGNRNGHSDSKDTDFGDFRNSRRVIER